MSPSQKSTKKQNDYHRYVFRNGRLLGDFEKMYSCSTVVPWRQDLEAASWIGDVAIDVLNAFSPYDSALEIGCGLGYFANRVFPLCRTMKALDKSPTAIAKASAVFKEISFTVGDVSSTTFKFGCHDLVIVKDLFWYVFPELNVVLKNILHSVKPNGYLFVFQSFPRLTKNFVGKKVISTPAALVSHLSRQFSLIHSCILQRHNLREEGPMFLGFFKRRSNRRYTGR